jgi:hypothetical protein
VPYLRVYGPQGNFVAHNWGTTSTQVAFTPTVSGLYTVIAGTNDAQLDAAGDYLISVVGACAPPPPPTAVPDAYATGFNTSLTVAAPGVLANDSGGTSVTLHSTATAGALTLNANGSFSYTPPNGFSGPATFQYRAVNASGNSAPATVTIQVSTTPPPTAVTDSYTVNRNQALVVAAPGVLANDVSPGGSALSATLVTGVGHGTVFLNSNGGFTYTPASGYTGSDQFSYRASNANAQSVPATVFLTVQDPTTVQAPTNLIAYSIAGNTVTLRWTPPASGPTATGYIMEGGIAPGQPLVGINTGSAHPIFTFVAPTGSFYLRIRSVAGAQTSTQTSNEIRVYVNMAVPPSAPTHLLGTANGQTLALSWRNTFGGGAPGNVILDVSGTLAASLPIGLTDTFTFTPVPGGNYNFAVRAANGAGTSAPSNTVNLSFPIVCTGAPQAPENFLAYNVGNTVNLLWDPASSGNAPTIYTLNVTGAFNLTLPVPTRAVSGGVPPGTYQFTVTAANACGASAPTAVRTVVIP